MKTVAIVLALCLILAAVACEPPRAGDEHAAVVAKVDAEVRRRATATRFAPVIIRLDMGAGWEALTSDSQAAAIRRVSESIVSELPRDAVRIVHFYSTVPIMSAWANDEGLAALAGNSAVERIVLDRADLASLDTSVPLIDADNVWPVAAGNGRFVAIIDSGIRNRHQFVLGRVTHEACFRRDTGCWNLLSWAVEAKGPGAARSNLGHGMHVAGIAAGAGGHSGILQLRGVAPGANIIAINVFSGDGAYVGDQVKALEWVRELKESNINVVAANLSLGDELKHEEACDFDEPERKLIIEKLKALGVATVVAAGNQGYRDGVNAPGCISTAVTVSSVGNDDLIYDDHNRSALTDLLAPGEAILSSWPDSAPNDYTSLFGTSMAAPHVSGAIALLSDAAPNSSVEKIVEALRDTGQARRDVNGREYRRIDLDDALVRLRRP